jgi:hypothetical protein
MIERAANRYGWRGLWLILFGAMWVAFGFGQLQAPTDRHQWVLFEYAPTWALVGGWVVTGAVAMWVGFRGPIRDDSLGHVALYVMPAIRVTSFLIGWVTWVATTATSKLTDDVPVTGWSGGWYAALIWGLISAMLLLGSRWPNPRPPLPKPPRDRAEWAGE